MPLKIGILHSKLKLCLCRAGTVQEELSTSDHAAIILSGAVPAPSSGFFLQHPPQPVPSEPSASPGTDTRG